MGVSYEAAWQIDDLEVQRSTLKRVVGIDQARTAMGLSPSRTPFSKIPNPLKTGSRVGLYKSYAGSMDEGWTRLVFDTFQVPYGSVSDAAIRSGDLPFDVIILPADSPNSITNGLNADRYPAEYAGGIGDPGVENLKRFVDRGGKLICFDDSCELVIKRFSLPMKNVLDGLKRNEFYDPGSIVRLTVDRSSPLAKGMGDSAAAYFSNSSAFEITDDNRVKSVARYASQDGLLSGWTLGEKFRNGKAALAEASFGKGKIVLFGFRPQHRGQTWGTFPFIFNALEK
jgi:hypothetical protein